MKRTITAISCAAVLLTACGEETVTNTADVTIDKVVEETEEISNELVLNGSEKWKANEETIFYIGKMTEEINAFTATEDLEEFNMLRQSMNEDYKQIFKNCSMKGEGHNQLHNYLMPLSEKLIGLESPNLEECQTALVEVKSQLELFHTFFE